MRHRKPDKPRAAHTYRAARRNTVLRKLKQMWLAAFPYTHISR